jgi:hypothetical protein
VLYRDDDRFGGTLQAAAERRNVGFEIVEKDYWVSEALRVLADEFREDFVFKGGTSLSKCYRCIQRFSEDIDILVLKNDRGRGACERLMKDMVASVADALELAPHNRNRGRDHHREYLDYTPLQPIEGAFKSSILLEMGTRGDDYPAHAALAVRPLVADDLEDAAFDISSYADLTEFEVPVLHPGRTLVEKILMLHNTVTSADWSAGPDPRLARFGRHYHDVQQLLLLDEVRVWLADREAFAETVTQHEAVNRDHFDTEVPPRPPHGYSDSDAFRRDFAENPTLERWYVGAMDELHLGPDPTPTWDEVMTTIEESADLL